MTRNKRGTFAWWIAAGFTLAMLIAAGMPLAAQTVVASQSPTIKHLEVVGQGTYAFVGSEMSFSDKVVKGAPYSAKAVTETIQTLSDGNRIVRRTTASVARDSEGRTRNEQMLPTIGPWAPESEDVQLITIHDPVENVTYIISPNKQSVQKLTHSEVNLTVVSEGKDKHVTAIVKPGAGVGGGTVSAGEKKISIMHATTGTGVEGGVSWTVKSIGEEQGDETTEVLPSKTIEGVLAEGKRTTRTIAAGAIGNELPIQIVTEIWFSPELQVTVLKTQKDPRLGETVYRLTAINRSEPDHSLFEIPSGYNIK